MLGVKKAEIFSMAFEDVRVFSAPVQEHPSGASLHQTAQHAVAAKVLHQRTISLHGLKVHPLTELQKFSHTQPMLDVGQLAVTFLQGVREMANVLNVIPE